MTQIDWSEGKYESTAVDLLPAARELVAAARIQPGEHVVDVGAGTGNVALVAVGLGARVTAVEPATRLREVIQEAAGARDLTVVDGNAAAIPLADGSADVILSNFAVIFAPDPRAAIAELARVAKPAGRILLTSWLPGVMDQIVGIVATAVREVTGASEATDGQIDWHDPRSCRSCSARIASRSRPPSRTSPSPRPRRRTTGRPASPTTRWASPRSPCSRRPAACLRSVPACSTSSPLTGPRRPGRSASPRSTCW